jgi:hypothetical protein
MNAADFQREVIEILRAAPHVLRPFEVAQRLGTTAGSISLRLNKLAAYGIIGKAHGAPMNSTVRGNVYLTPEPPAVCIFSD